jgi:hypothetical protein
LKKTLYSPFRIRLCLTLLAVLQVGAILLALEKPAMAYVDPGSGFVLLQVAGSMLAGALFYVRHRIRKLFGLGRKSGEPARSSAGTEATENQL